MDKIQNYKDYLQRIIDFFQSEKETVGNLIGECIDDDSKESKFLFNLLVSSPTYLRQMSESAELELESLNSHSDSE